MPTPPESQEETAHSHLSFEIRQSSPTTTTPRLGLLHVPTYTPIPTPTFIAPTSRGIVPHLAPDVLAQHARLSGVYTALEDLIEHAPAHASPVFQQPVPSSALLPSSVANARDVSRLRAFTALPDDVLLVLGARRTPPLVCPSANADGAVAVCTSVGFQQMGTGDFVGAARRLRPDVVVALGDVLFPLAQRPGGRRREKMAGRTERWVRELIVGLEEDSELEGVKRPAVFAPVLPLERAQQQWYLDCLASSDVLPKLAGLAVYSDEAGAMLPSSLASLPRLALSEPYSPQDVLKSVLIGGADIFAVPFAGRATDAGVALTFDFPPPTTASFQGTHNSPVTTKEDEEEIHGSNTEPKPKTPLGFSCADPSLATSLTPLHPTCTCYACTTHHRAYLHHLLSAKEMLAWVLLQIHNLAVLDRFFAGIRTSIAAGPDVFEAAVRRFEDVYEDDVLLGMESADANSGVRLRGYQRRNACGATGGAPDAQKTPRKGERKLNKPAWTGLGGVKAVQDKV